MWRQIGKTPRPWLHYCFSRLDQPFVPGTSPTSPFRWITTTDHLHARCMTVGPQVYPHLIIQGVSAIRFPARPRPKALPILRQNMNQELPNVVSASHRAAADYSRNHVINMMSSEAWFVL